MCLEILLNGADGDHETESREESEESTGQDEPCLESTFWKGVVERLDYFGTFEVDGVYVFVIVVDARVCCLRFGPVVPTQWCCFGPRRIFGYDLLDGGQCGGVHQSVAFSRLSSTVKAEDESRCFLVPAAKQRGIVIRPLGPLGLPTKKFLLSEIWCLRRGPSGVSRGDTALLWRKQILERYNRFSGSHAGGQLSLGNSTRILHGVQLCTSQECIVLIDHSV